MPAQRGQAAFEQFGARQEIRQQECAADPDARIRASIVCRSSSAAARVGTIDGPAACRQRRRRGRQLDERIPERGEIAGADDPALLHERGRITIFY